MLLLWLVVGCDFSSIELDKVKGPTLNNVFAINLGNIKYTAGELIDNLEDETLEIVEGSDFSISFIHRDTSVFDDVSEFIRIDDISNSDTFAPFDMDLPALPSEQVVVIPTKTFEFEFYSEGGEQIDSTFFKGGILEYTITSDFGSKIEYTFTLNDVQQLSGEPIVFNNTLEASESSAVESISLNGLKNVSERSGDVNLFSVSLDMTFTIPAGTTINAMDEISLELIFQDSEFSAIFGDFGGDHVEVQEDSVELGAFDDFNEGGLFLRTPSIQLEFENTFGVELGLDLNGVKSVDSDLSEILLSGSVVDNVQFIDAPNHLQVGESAISSIVLDINNSNIDELLNSTPEKIFFAMSAAPNPVGSDNLNNYLFDSSYLEIRTTLEIPLDFRMDGFSKDFEISISGSDLDDADSLSINARVLNAIPFSGSLDLDFKNESGEVIYTLPDIAIIESPDIGLDGRTVGTRETNVSIKLDDEGIAAFLETTDIVARVNIFTFGYESEQYVKIFSDYQLEIYLTAEGKVGVEL